MKLSSQIFLALVAAIAVGAAARWAHASAIVSALVALEPIGTIFIRLITMVVVPLVIASVFVGIASLGDVKSVGRLGGRTLLYFAVTTIAAATIGVTIALLANLGSSSFGAVQTSAGGGAQTAPGSAATLVGTLVAMTPQNPVAAAAQADLLPLIVAVCIFGAAATKLSQPRRALLIDFFSAVNDLAMVVIGWVMRVAPLAVFVLIASLVATSGIALLRELGTFVGIVVVALIVHVVLVLLPILRFVAQRAVVQFFRTVADALLLAFSTASSSATLPVSIAAAERLRISPKVASFVLSTGTTLNKNGAAVYKAATAVFLAHIYGVLLSANQIVTIVLTSSLAAAAGAGVPGSSLVTTMIVLNAIGLGPAASAGIALVAGVDRPVDMCRTTVNTIGNLVGAAVVGRVEERGRG